MPKNSVYFIGLLGKLSPIMKALQTACVAPWEKPRVLWHSQRKL